MTKPSVPPFWQQDPAVCRLFEVLSGSVRFVGGCVRDALLGKTGGDIDLATPLTPDVVTDKLEKAGIKVVPTGLKFGTVTAIIGTSHYEITTLRKDLSCDGRHAQVLFTDDYQEDAARRDFTMNAMSCDQAGQLYDYFGGYDDLQHGRVRFVGNATQRCTEDVLRILRFFRFHAYYGKAPMDIEALIACRACAPSIASLSGERIQTEMVKLLRAASPIISLQAMETHGVLAHIIGIADVSWDGLLRQQQLEIQYHLPIDPWIRLAHIVTPDAAEALIERWKLSHADSALLRLLLTHAAQGTPDITAHYPAIRRYGKTSYAAMLRLRWAEAKAQDDVSYHALYQAIEPWVIPVFPIKGADLFPLGFTAGKRMGEVLRQAENWWESNGYRADRAAVLSYISELHHP